MRGAPEAGPNYFLVVGIIPAYAGSTPLANVATNRHRDHPRVCGEHDLGVTRLAAVVGSSPRMRGARRAVAAPIHAPRIIPAYAGST